MNAMLTNPKIRMGNAGKPSEGAQVGEEIGVFLQPIITYLLVV
jgi:hypothetical protein